MEHQGSLMCSHKPTICPYPVPTLPFYFFKFLITVILFSPLCLGDSSGLFSSGFPSKTFFSSPKCHVPHPPYLPWFYHHNNKWWGIHRS